MITKFNKQLCTQKLCNIYCLKQEVYKLVALVLFLILLVKKSTMGKYHLIFKTFNAKKIQLSVSFFKQYVESNLLG